MPIPPPIMDCSKLGSAGAQLVCEVQLKVLCLFPPRSGHTKGTNWSDLEPFQVLELPLGDCGRNGPLGPGRVHAGTEICATSGLKNGHGDKNGRLPT